MKKVLFFASAMMLFASCAGPAKQEKDLIADNIDFACKQIGLEIDKIEASGKILNPVTLRPDGSVYYCKYNDWRSGFFPGSVWFLYELTKDEKYLPLAEKYTEALAEVQTMTAHHDIGFIVMSSYGNGLRLAGIESYKDAIVKSAQSLCTRFREAPGIIQSWDTKGWQGERGWECPVIIDNMMNLELLFKATELTGDSTYYKVAVSHADRTMKEHFRENASCYHVIDYSLTTGEVRNRHTAQGYAHESIWSRGQAWAVYGYAMCYRFTGDRRYLDQSLKTFEMMKNHPRMPEDLIPYWDMDAPNIPNEPRDVSTAACIASALYEICTMDVENPAQYKEYADKIMESLSTDAYRTPLGTNGNFLLLHSVGSIPHNNEIDVPLNYADYYFLEALARKKALEEK